MLVEEQLFPLNIFIARNSPTITWEFGAASTITLQSLIAVSGLTWPWTPLLPPRLCGT